MQLIVLLIVTKSQGIPVYLLKLPFRLHLNGGQFNLNFVEKNRNEISFFENGIPEADNFGRVAGRHQKQGISRRCHHLEIAGIVAECSLLGSHIDKLQIDDRPFVHRINSPTGNPDRDFLGQCIFHTTA